MKVRKDKIGYIILVHDYGNSGTMVTLPTALHGKMLPVTDGLNTVAKDSELKNRYPIYTKYPNKDVVLNIVNSNQILESQGKAYRNVIHECIIPKGANTEKFVGGHINGEQSNLFLSDAVIIK